jgi:D-3-phosphoglycerate dehydrogenase / 2-oxoglutarate reductase
MNSSAERPVVVALGHTFPDLDIERRTLAGCDVDLLDGNLLEADAAAWKRVTGVLLGTADRVDGARMEALPACKAIVRYGIGVDNVDLTAARERDIAVCNVRDYCIEEVADHALALALSLTRGLSHWDASVRRGVWRSGNAPALQRNSTRTFGLIGFGQIGRLLASRAARVFGRVLVHDPWADLPGRDLDANIAFVRSLDAVLEQADVLSVHVPLTPETRGLIGSGQIERMPRGAFIINVSRGGIVGEAAVAEAVSGGHLGGAAFDTFDEEPLPRHHPFLDEPRILLSPHVAWLSGEAAVDLRQRASEEMARLLSGSPAVSRVDLQAEASG